MIKKYLPVVLFCVGCLAVLYSIFVDGSYVRMKELTKSLEAQKRLNTELGEKVAGLKDKVNGVTVDDRALEKAARNELGLARPNELIFFFEKSEEKGTNSGRNENGGIE